MYVCKLFLMREDTIALRFDPEKTTKLIMREDIEKDNEGNLRDYFEIAVWKGGERESFDKMYHRSDAMARMNE
ncbi:MAG: hypothetical protein KAS32_30035 [Candidatus Peribacteraceae bacterium]|nr:hypothetical protein [Candidatus Peribacteraceae bacterium]